ncbi:hypothetical protein M9Y10_016268 [Tritrichomonas musculus]|uniref:DUF3447 domain-containing protein n=1 Tax=Tritrichomonas musculus TaxID=1915356 RepID=A0ABR2HVV8_9EUKA
MSKFWFPMDPEHYLGEMKKIQENLLNFIDEETGVDENFQNLKVVFDEFKIVDDKNILKSTLHLLSRVIDNHHRGPSFFDKIEKIITLLKSYITKYYSNLEIFNIFKRNKRILLFLIEEKIITMNQSIVLKLLSDKYVNRKYPEYFSPEIKPFIKENWFPKRLKNKILFKLPENFNEKRKIGENDDYLCELIRNDLIEEFIKYVNLNNIKLNEIIIPESIYETNSILIEKSIDSRNLHCYALFFGSIRIFQYLRNEIYEWPLGYAIYYAVHSRNQEIIRIVEENSKNLHYSDFLMESLKCHHNEIVEYIRDNYLQYDLLKDKEIFYLNLKLHNFEFITNNYLLFPQIFNNFEEILYHFVKYDYYYLLVDFLVKNKEIDINAKIKIIKKSQFFIMFQIQKYFNETDQIC